MDLGSSLGTVVGLLVNLVLFEGGLAAAARRRAAHGVLRTWRCACWWPLAGRCWLPTGWLVELVAGRGVQRHRVGHNPAVVNPLVQQMRLQEPLGEVLEGEGLVLEPIGAVLAVMLLELVLGDRTGWQGVAAGLLLRLGFGVAMGLLSGLLLSELLRRLPADSGVLGLRVQLTLGILFLMYGGCDAQLSESGFPAAVAAGWWWAAGPPRAAAA